MFNVKMSNTRGVNFYVKAMDAYLRSKYLGLELQILKLVGNFNLKAYVLYKTFRKLINHAQFALTESSAINPKP
jgi:hypothetical protein